MTKETELATQLFDLSLADIEKLNMNAIKSAFAPFDERQNIISNILQPRYAALRG